MSLRLKQLVLLLSVTVLLGMGSIGGVPEGTLPDVEENFVAKIEDRDGVVTEVSQFSIDGNLYLAGARGQGQVTIQLHDLKLLVFGTVATVDVPIRCTLEDGKQIELRVRKRATFYGKGDFGVFQIQARHIKRIFFP